MSVEKSLEPLSPAGIRSNVGEQRLNDQRDHVKAVVANAACFPRHWQFRLDGKFSIPQPAVMRTDVADRRQGMKPAYKDGLRLIEFAGDFLPQLVLKCSYIFDSAPKLISSVAIHTGNSVSEVYLVR
jgi:hypothetical protein